VRDGATGDTRLSDGAIGDGSSGDAADVAQADGVGSEINEDTRDRDAGPVGDTATVDDTVSHDSQRTDALGTDTGMDSGVIDALGTDARADVLIDVPVDIPMDTRPDVPTDAPMDTPTDVRPDTPTDVPPGSCLRNADCRTGEYCSAPACTGLGTCVAFSADPCTTGSVCGCDGRGYPSACDAARADVRVSSRGPCIAPTDSGGPDSGAPSCAGGAMCPGGYNCCAADSICYAHTCVGCCMP